MHEKADVWHARIGANLLANYCATDRGRPAAVDASDRVLERVMVAAR